MRMVFTTLIQLSSAILSHYHFRVYAFLSTSSLYSAHCMRNDFVVYAGESFFFYNLRIRNIIYNNNFIIRIFGKSGPVVLYACRRSFHRFWCMSADNYVDDTDENDNKSTQMYTFSQNIFFFFYFFCKLIFWPFLFILLLSFGCQLCNCENKFK